MSDAQTFETYVSFYQISAGDEANFKALKPFLQEALPLVLGKFYEFVITVPQTKAIIGSRSTDMLKSAQTDHWLSVCDQGIDETYQERVNRIGHAHVRIGLGPMWYVGGYSHIQQNLLEELSTFYKKFNRFKSRPRGLPNYLAAQQCIAKIMMLDMAMAIETYNQVREGTFKNIFELTDNFTNGLQARVEQSAAATNELSASIDTINKETTDSRSLMEQVAGHATEASGAVGNLADLMNDISQMVVLIEDVSEQINLLSLNAAIESARAGEAGRGFAVVADEVRKLADKTSVSTKEISSKVGHIQQVSQESSAMLGQIVTSVEQAQGRLSGISASISEQTIATGEISDGMTSLLNEVHDTGSKIKQEIDSSH